MRNIIRFILVLALSGLILPATGLSQKAVEVRQVQNGEFVEIRASNPNPFPVTAEIRLSTENLALTGNRQVTLLLNAHNNRLVKRLRIMDRNVSWDVGSEVRTATGNIFATVNEDYPYQLPFGNMGEYRVEQGYGGLSTHFGRGRYAVDFSMPEGTSVHAVRDGVVTGLRKNSNWRGLNQSSESEGNFIMILHEDGSIAVYAHLERNGVLVETGQHVEEGEQIGLSGNTGYSHAPHLHFMVGRFDLNGTFSTFPVKFITDRGVISELENGEVYGKAEIGKMN
ncbi:MAG: M23 family metallopeptidase [Balneolaceae bacterium]